MRKSAPVAGLLMTWLGVGLANPAWGGHAGDGASVSQQCQAITARQDLRVPIVSNGPGVLVVRLQERGVSVVARFDDAGAAGEAASAIERFGTIGLVLHSTRVGTHQLRIHPEDSPELSGSICMRIQQYADSNNVPVRAETALSLAGQAMKRRDWQTAFQQYLAAAAGFDAVGAWRSSGAMRHALAELAYRRFDRKRDSYALANEALADYARTPRVPSEDGLPDELVVGLLTALEGKSLLDTPGVDVNLAAPVVRRLFAVARRYDTASGLGTRELPRLDIMSGFLEFTQNAPARASELFTRAASTCRALGDWECYAIANQNLAAMAEDSSNYATALSEYAQTLQVLPPQLNPKLSADILNNYGRVQGVVGLFSSSERSHALAMRDYAQLQDCPGVRRSLSLTGRLMVHFGSLSDAEDYLQSAASRSCQDLLRASDSVSQPMAPPDREPACGRPLDPSSLALDNKQIVFDSLLALGGALMLEGNPTAARRCYESAQGYAASAHARMQLANARGQRLLDENLPDAARAQFQLSLQVAREAQIPLGYEHRVAAQLGLVRVSLLAGRAPQSVQDAWQALQVSVMRGDIEQTVTALRLLAAGLRRDNQPEEAAQTLRTAADLTQAVPIDDLDGEKRATYLATQQKVFADLTDLYAAQAMTSDASQAFLVAEEGRARSLRYAINQMEQNAEPAQTAPPALTYHELLHEMTDLTSASPPLSRTSLIERLDSAARRQRGPEAPLDQTQLSRILTRLNATLIEYVATERDMYAFVVDAESTEVIRLGDRARIAQAATQLHESLRATEPRHQEIRGSAERLARLVLWPLRSHLADRPAHNRLLLVPDDALQTIPFHVLPWGPEQPELLIQHAELSVLPSALFLTRVRETSGSGRIASRMALIGDPVFRTSDVSRECSDLPHASNRVTVARGFTDWTEWLPRLPGSRTEIQDIAQLAHAARPGSQVQTFLGCAAVASSLRTAANEHVGLLHIATHARVDAQRPRLSALALTPEGGAPSGAFGLLDILSLKLDSGLVVLSACDTSRGRLLPGEGLLGPAQAFLQSGAAAVLASYWKVDDAATASFMTSFYRHLLLGHENAASALRAAQLAAASQSNSYDWATFALYGLPDVGL